MSDGNEQVTPTGHRVEVERGSTNVHLVVVGKQGGEEKEILRVTKNTSNMGPEEISEMIEFVLDLPTEKVYKDLLDEIKRLSH